MYKCALVVVIILSSIVPLLAWRPSWPFKWPPSWWPFRRTTPRPAHPNNTTPIYHPPTCKWQYSTSCDYPRLCNCPMSTMEGYIRYANKKDYPWYFDNITMTCKQARGDHSGCNRFTERKHCQRDCAIPIKKALKRRYQGIKFA
uniref:Pancreatic trypsin inhibitor n=1 Tax=Rhipicephalus zambeziensis TaxID=60191 RepID=A0A224YBL8_9ACAR